MVRLISALILVLLIATPTLGQQSLVGTYKLVSLVVEVDGTPIPANGEGSPWLPRVHANPPNHFYTAENRKFGTSVDEKAALFDSMVGYAGVYRVEGDKLIFTTDVSWIEAGTERLGWKRCQLSGNRLTTTLGPMPLPRDPSKTMISRKVWEKIE